ncbi:hypothetical protein CAC42_7022 [Sphaceloma murrayae]|uniref:Potassium transport protein n=1 Tax=Sphaceloma murrayae TaxID=2082308 RepID=A0A2K1QQT4_9PEZI|nr:hypothetical protein CAC42_7022 [Sphaceloma murrayae]
MPRARFNKLARKLKDRLPPVNFITIHYTYFICTCLLSAVILWVSSTTTPRIYFIDALFLATSAMTLAGLNTINLSVLNTFQQFLLFFLIMIGSSILVSAAVVLFRRRAFENKFQDIVKAEKARRSRRASTWTDLPFTRSHSRRKSEDHPATDQRLQEALPDLEDGIASVTQSFEYPIGIVDHGGDFSGTTAEDMPPLQQKTSSVGRQHIVFSEDVTSRPSMHQVPASPSGPRVKHRPSFMSARGVGAHPNASLRRSRTNDSHIAANSLKAPSIKKDKSPFHLSLGIAGRNSQFHGLSEKERERLGGVEYRALVFLSWTVPLYYVLFQFFGCLGLGAWVANNRPETTRRNGVNPWWLGSFNAVSAFNNSGMSVLDQNMTVFQDAYYMLLTMSFLILAGNTCYPIFLRLIIWTMWKLLPHSESWQESRTTLRFLLDHPRRCYTNLFPSRHTWWLLTAVVVLNGVDWAAFEILNIGNRKITDLLPINLRVIDGLFQAFAVRSGGFYVVPLPLVRISLQVLYVVMMYISVYPVVITMRNSNVYEERSLGIYSEDPAMPTRPSEEEEPRSLWGRITGVSRHVSSFQESRSYFVRQQVRAQLAHDIWWLVLAIFLIMIIEGDKFEEDPVTFSVFNTIFETVSGYGTVGISIGVPYDNFSFCGAWTTLSKLILCLVMLRGRHRGLPVAIDRAILLPHEHLAEAEEEDAMIRLERSVSRSRADMST